MDQSWPSLAVFLLMQLTGTYAVIFYAVSLFRDIGVSTNPYIPAIVTGKKIFNFLSSRKELSEIILLCSIFLNRKRKLNFLFYCYFTFLVIMSVTNYYILISKTFFVLSSGLIRLLGSLFGTILLKHFGRQVKFFFFFKVT